MISKSLRTPAVLMICLGVTAAVPAAAHNAVSIKEGLAGYSTTMALNC
jgi:hypothetical protein